MALDVFSMVQQLTAECARCGRKAIDLCSCPCRLVFYCNVKCQQEHWPIHKEDCTKARRGRLPQSFCSYCGVASVSLKSCMCESALYCSFECQRKHYGTHGRTCSAAVPRFRKRRQKPSALAGALDESSPLPEAAVKPVEGAKPVTLQETPSGQGDADGPEMKTMEIQTDESCEALLVSIKAQLAAEAELDTSSAFASPKSSDGPQSGNVSSAEALRIGAKPTRPGANRDDNDNGVRGVLHNTNPLAGAPTAK
jgi:hypothetical protein